MHRTFLVVLALAVLRTPLGAQPDPGYRQGDRIRVTISEAFRPRTPGFSAVDEKVRRF